MEVGSAELAALNLDALMHRGRSVRDQIEVLQQEIDKLEELKKELDVLMLEKMGENGIDRTGNDVANISLSVSEQASVENWDELYAFIKEHDAWHLLQRRIANKAALEYKTSEETIPGVMYYEKTALSFRRKN